MSHCIIVGLWRVPLINHQQLVKVRLFTMKCNSFKKIGVFLRKQLKQRQTVTMAADFMCPLVLALFSFVPLVHSWISQKFLWDALSTSISYSESPISIHECTATAKSIMIVIPEWLYFARNQTNLTFVFPGIWTATYVTAKLAVNAGNKNQRNWLRCCCTKRWLND